MNAYVPNHGAYITVNGACSLRPVSAYDAAVQQLEQAAGALNWEGHIIPDVEVLGARFAAVTRVLPEVHRWRTAHGCAPQLDPAWFRSWSEPDSRSRPPTPAVDLLGVLVPVRKLRHALRACGTLMTLAPCTVVLPEDHRYRTWPMIELDYYGIGVVTAGRQAAKVLLRPEDRTAEFGSSPFGRWLLEVLYARMLRRAPDEAPTSGC